MEKTRVPKGEKYFYVNEIGNVSNWEDTGGQFATMHFLSGNYFHSKESAESMARKFRAVLNGAEVIEMPSEEEYEKIIPQRIGCSDEFAAGEGNGYWHGYNYLKSKIVK